MKEFLANNSLKIEINLSKRHFVAFIIKSSENTSKYTDLIFLDIYFYPTPTVSIYLLQNLVCKCTLVLSSEIQMVQCMYIVIHSIH